MNILIKKAVKEALISNKDALQRTFRMSDSLHDILLYLNESKDELPTVSEVSVEELFGLVNNCITDYEKVARSLKESNEWLDAIAKQ